MIWQDIVLSTGQWVFILALLPSIFSSEKPAILTSLITGLVLAVFAFTFYTLELLASAVSTACVSLTWAILVFQALKIRRNKNVQPNQKR